jgi:hypothetical protein
MTSDPQEEMKWKVRRKKYIIEVVRSEDLSLL